MIGFAQIVAFAYDLGALFLDPNNLIKILLTLLPVYIYFTEGFHLHLWFSLQIHVQCISLMWCEITVILPWFHITLCVSYPLSVIMTWNLCGRYSPSAAMLICPVITIFYIKFFGNYDLEMSKWLLFPYIFCPSISPFETTTPPQSEH